MRYYWQYLNTIGSSDITTLIDNNVIVFYNNATLELPTNVSAWFSISIDHKLHSTPTKDTTCSPQLLTQRRLTVSLIVLTTVYYQCGWQTRGLCRRGVSIMTAPNWQVSNIDKTRERHWLILDLRSILCFDRSKGFVCKRIRLLS